MNRNRRPAPRAFRALARLPRPRLRLRLEPLEGRDVPTSVLYLDFGDNLPAGGFNLSVNQLKGTFGGGGIQGPDLTSGQTNNLAGGNNLQFQNLGAIVTSDYNGDGVVNGQDYTDLKAAVLQLTQRYYAPFDLNVQVAPALDTTSSTTYRNGIISTLQAGANTTGERDCYLLVGTMRDTTIGQDIGNYEGLNGIAAGTDIGGNNATDDSALVFGNSVINGLTASKWDTALAHDTSHEPAHTFGLQHTSPTAGNNNLLTQTDVIRQGGSQGVALANFNTFTRFPLPTVSGVPATVNNFDRLSDPNLLGPKAGFPAYVTGTGASDKITITAGGGGTAKVKVQAYTDNTYATQIGSDFNYSVSTANGILVDTGFGDDITSVAANLGVTVTVRGMGGNDRLVIAGAGSGTATYTPGTNSANGLDDNPDLRGTVTAGSTTVNFQEFRAASQVAINNVPTVTLNGTSGNDAFTLSTPSGTVRTDGTVSGVTMVPLVLTTVPTFAIAAGGGTDTITGDNTARTYSITGAGSGTISGILTGGFTGVENLIGGSANDSFNFGTGGSLAGNIDGGSGTNTITGDNTGRTFTVMGANSGTIGTLLGGTFANIQNLTGGTGNDIFPFADGGSLTGNINGGAGTNTVIGDNTGRTFTVTGANTGTVSTILGGTFSNIENLTGGTANDNFLFSGGTLAGNIDGGAGTNTIVGDNTARTFAITGTNAGTVSTILGGTFSNIENLTGGTAGDLFLFNTGGTLGGNIDGGGGTNTITGDSTGRTFTVTAPNTGTIGTLLGGTFANIQNLTGGSGDDTFQFAYGGSLSGNIDGGAGNNTLIGDDTGRTYTVTGANAGTVSTILGGTFVRVENLKGGAGNDTLVVGAAGSLAGSFDGEGGTDTVDLSAVLTGQSLTVAALGTVDGFNVTGSLIAGGLLNINALTATAAIDTLTGLNANTLWTLTGINVGSYEDIGSSRTMPFTSFENLVGGSGDDQFVFANGGSLTGTVAGGGGTDTVQGDDGGRTFAVTGAGSGTVSAILPAGFTGIENLLGGTGADELVVGAAGSLAGFFDGGAGTDTVDLSALPSQQITATALGGVDGFNTTGGSAIAGGLFNLDSLIGSLSGTADMLTGLDAAGTYTVSAANTGTYQDNTSARTLAFANIENLTGGLAADTLVVQATGFLGGTFDGKGGYDTADLSALGAQSPVIAAVGATDGYNLTGVTAVAGGLLDLDKIIGSAAATTNNLTGRNVAATWTVDAANAGHYVDTSTRTLDLSNFENLSGGTDNDTLVMKVGGSLAGAFDGGLGVDTADFSALAAQQFEVKALGTADGYDVTNVPTVAGDLKNIDALVGSTAGTTDSLTGLNTASTYTLTGPNAGTYMDNASARPLTFSQVKSLNGGTADDLLVVKTGGSLAGAFDGGAGTDTADLSDLAAVQSISVLALGATDGFNTTGGTAVAGGFLNLDRLIGGKSASATLGAGDRLTGQNADATWEVKAGVDQSFYQDVGSGRKLLFASFEELYGGSQKDAVTVDFSAGNPLATTGLTVDGQAGADSLTTIGAATHNTFGLGVKTFRVNGHVIRYKNFERLTAQGGAGNDVFSAPNISLPSMVKLVQFFGGAGNDTAYVSPTTLALLYLDGGTGTNTLHVLQNGEHYLAPIPPKSAVDGTYFFSNRKAIQFLNWQIRDIGVTQPQP